MGNISDWISENIGLSAAFQGKMLASVLLITALLFIRKLILRIIKKRILSPKAQYNWRKTTSYVFSLLIIFTVAPIWVSEFSSWTTFLGLLSAGLAIALREPVSNFFGWVYIIFQKPFELGDRIQIGKLQGDVLDISLFQFSMMEIGTWVDADQSTGRIIHIPNGKIFTDALLNYNQGFPYIWNEIPILLTFESNWRKAKEILLDIENRRVKTFGTPENQQVISSSHKLMIHFSKLTPTVYTSVKDSGILLTIRYLCHPKNRRESQQIIWEEVLVALEKNQDIVLAYPTQRIFIPEMKNEKTRKEEC